MEPRCLLEADLHANKLDLIQNIHLVHSPSAFFVQSHRCDLLLLQQLFGWTHKFIMRYGLSDGETMFIPAIRKLIRYLAGNPFCRLRLNAKQINCQRPSFPTQFSFLLLRFDSLPIWEEQIGSEWVKLEEENVDSTETSKAANELETCHVSSLKWK